jgi:hypothetical protein
MRDLVLTEQFASELEWSSGEYCNGDISARTLKIFQAECGSAHRNRNHKLYSKSVTHRMESCKIEFDEAVHV